MAAPDYNTQLDTMGETTLESIEKLFEELGREPSSLELSLYSSYTKRDQKTDEKYHHEIIPIDNQRELVLVSGAIIIRFDSKRQENPQRVLRNAFKKLSMLGAKPSAQHISIAHPILNTRIHNTNLEYITDRLSVYSRHAGIPTAQVSLYTHPAYDHYFQINVLISGTRNSPEVHANAQANKLVLLTVPFEACDGIRDNVLSKFYREIQAQIADGWFSVTGHQGILGELFHHLHNENKGISFNTEGFESFCETPDELLIRRFKTEIVVRTHNPGEIVQKAASKNIQASIIGEITNTQRLRISKAGKDLANLPLSLLNSPAAYIGESADTETTCNYLQTNDLPSPDNLHKTAISLFDQADEQYSSKLLKRFSHSLGANLMSQHFHSDATMVKLRDADGALATSTVQHIHRNDDALTDHINTLAAHATRQIAASGAITKSLSISIQARNIPTQEAQTLDTQLQQYGLELSRTLAIPVHTQLVCARKDTDQSAPSPLSIVAQATGLLADTDNLLTQSFKSKGDLIFLIGETENNLAGSLYAEHIHGRSYSQSPQCNWPNEQKLQNALTDLAEFNIIRSAHSIARGGLLTALKNCCSHHTLGFDITSIADVRDDAFLFGESPSRALVSLTIHKRRRFIDYLTSMEIPFTILGHVTKGELRIEDKSYGFITEYQQ